MTWPTKKLGEIARIFSGSSAPQDEKYFKNGKYPFVRVFDLATPRSGVELVETRDYVNDLAITELNLVEAKKGAIVFPKSGASVLNNNRAMLGTNAYVVSHLSAIEADEDLAVRNWVYYFLSKFDMGKLVSDPGYPSLNISAIEKIKIPVPPLAIQKQIVERLDKIAEAQKLNGTLIQKSDELFQSLLHKELNPAGKDWSTKRLKEICEINPSKAKINKLSANTSVSFLAMADVSESAEITNRQEKKISEVKNGFTFFEDGDVLVAKITPCFENGKGALVENMKNGIGFGSTEFHVLRSNSKILLNQFLYYLVSDKKFRKIGAKFMTGSAGQRRVPKQYLENHKITLPPLETQKKIVAKLFAVQDYKKQLLEQKSKLKELFDSVLAKSMIE